MGVGQPVGVASVPRVTSQRDDLKKQVLVHVFPTLDDRLQQIVKNFGKLDGGDILLLFLPGFELKSLFNIMTDQKSSCRFKTLSPSPTLRLTTKEPPSSPITLLQTGTPSVGAPTSVVQTPGAVSTEAASAPANICCSDLRRQLCLGAREKKKKENPRTVS